MPRSGTTVFSRLFSRSTGILISPETHFLREPYKSFAHLDLSLEKNLELVLNNYSKGRWFKSLDLTVEEIKSKFKGQQEESWPKLFQTIIELYALKYGASYYGEKTPGHYKNVSDLLNWFPNCKVVYVFRNPIDVISSNLRAPFASSSVILNALRYKEVFRSYSKYCHYNRVFLVRYEDFVKTPEQSINSIVEIHQEKKDFIQTHHKEEGWRSMHLEKASAPISSGSIGKGEKHLNNYEKWVIEFILSKELKGLKYTRGNRNFHLLSFPVKILFHWFRDRISAKIRISFLNKSEEVNLSLIEQFFVKYIPICERFIYQVLKNIHRIKENLIKTDYDCVFKINENINCRSSYERLHVSGESIGLELIVLVEKGENPALLVDNFKSFLVARNIVRSFWLTNQVSIIYKSEVVNG